MFRMCSQNRQSVVKEIQTTGERLSTTRSILPNLWPHPTAEVHPRQNGPVKGAVLSR